MFFFNISKTQFSIKSESNININKFNDFIDVYDSYEGSNLNIIISDIISCDVIPCEKRKDVFWIEKEEKLNVYIINYMTRSVYTRMIFDKSYKNAILYHTCSKSELLKNAIDLTIFFFYQVRLLFASGILLHSSAIEWKGKGILFSAPSGTGKSTQAALWVQHENAAIINGDRPAITVINGSVEVHGTPWSGSDPIVRNTSVSVSCIVMLEQASENEIIELSIEESLNLILPRFLMPYFDKKLTEMALDIVEKIIRKIPIYKLRCRPDLGAVDVLKKELSLLEE